MYIYIYYFHNNINICSAFYNVSLKQIVNLTIIEIFFLYLTVDLILITIKIFVLFDNKVDFILFGNVGSAQRKSFDYDLNVGSADRKSFD